MRLFRKTSKKVECPDVKQSPFDDESSIGSILLRMQKITKEQLYKAVGVQARANDHLLGALLIEQEAVSQVDVAKALEIQHKLRTGSRADAELAMLENVMAESESCSADLDRAIAKRKQSKRDRGENTGLFLVYPPAKTA